MEIQIILNDANFFGVEMRFKKFAVFRHLKSKTYNHHFIVCLIKMCEWPRHREMLQFQLNALSVLAQMNIVNCEETVFNLIRCQKECKLSASPKLGLRIKVVIPCRCNYYRDLVIYNYFLLQLSTVSLLYTEQIFLAMHFRHTKSHNSFTKDIPKAQKKKRKVLSNLNNHLNISFFFVKIKVHTHTQLKEESGATTKEPENKFQYMITVCIHHLLVYNFFYYHQVCIPIYLTTLFATILNFR